MFLKKKNRVLQTLDTMFELIEFVSNSRQVELLGEVDIALDSILKYVEEEENIEQTKKQLDYVITTLKAVIEKDEEVTFDELNELFEQLGVFEQLFIQEVKTKLNVVFMPYNVTMWDSLESIYFACKADEDCVARIVPVPFYDISGKESVENYHIDQYDKELEVIDHREFDLAKEEPDIIYVHNIYDYSNILTCVHPNYHTDNLKKYTDMLVYSPYCVPNFRSVIAPVTNTFTFELAGAVNVDRFVSAGDFVLNQGLRLGFAREKILNFGTPKFDSLITNIFKDFDYPQEWIDKSKDKRVVVWATSIAYFIGQHNTSVDLITNHFLTVETFGKTLATFKENDIFVIWRPHPLTRNFIQKSAPHLLGWYDYVCKAINEDRDSIYENVVLDTQQSYLPAFAISDALVTNTSSIVYPYMLLNKKLILSGNSNDYVKVGATLDDDKIEFLHEHNKDTFKVLTSFSKRDKIEVDNKMLSKFYKNLDGTAGAKIHKAVKGDVLEEFNNGY